MRLSLLPLLLVAALALVGVATAGASENFQNGPGMAYRAAGSPMEITNPATINSPISGFQELRYVIDGFGRNTLLPGTPANEASFVVGGLMTKSTNAQTLTTDRIYVYGAGGTYIANMYLTGIDYCNPDYNNLYNAFRFTFRRIDQKLYLYVNEQQVKDLGAVSSQPSFYVFPGNADDFTIGSIAGGVLGGAPDTWYVAKDIIEPSMNGLYDGNGLNIRNTKMYVSYNIFGDPETATIAIDGDYQKTTIQPKYIPFRVDSTWYNNTPTYSGIHEFNLTEFMSEKEYGRHTIELTTSTGTVSTDFYYKGAATLSTTITFDRDVYVQQDPVVINSTIGTTYWQPGVYSYYGTLYDPFSGEFKGSNWSITTQTQTHTTTVASDLFPASGEYITMLFAVDSQGNHILLDEDTAQVYTDKVAFSGTVWDAVQRTVISGATVSLTQGGTAASQTTGSDGRFEFLGLSKDVLTQLSASKTGFVTAWSNTTPTEYKRYEVDILLLNSSIAHTGEAVFGAVRCYPDGATVGGAAVQILKDGVQVNSTTAAEKGFYLFDGLDEATTYTIEAQKTGYADYSNAVMTGGGGSLTQFDPWLLPQYDYSLTVNLKNAVTNQTITGQMAVSVGGQSVQTTTGTATFNSVPAGACQVAVVGDGYDPYQTDPFDLSRDTTKTLYITPGIVVVTTTPGMTPTPTPAIIDMGGTVYDGMTGLPIQGATVTVEMGQGGTTRSDTSDANGAYGIPNLQNGVLTTVNATAEGYEHTPFSFTPQGAAEYVVNVVMYRTDESENPTIDPQPGKAGAGGMVLGGDMHLPLNSPTVTASNGTWNGTATVTDTGVWYFDNLEPNAAYDFTASDEGYVTNTVQATMGAPDSFTVVEIVLAGVYDVTIEIHDAESYAIIYKPVSLTLSNGVKGNTSTGSYVFTNLQYAQYVVTAACEGYTAGGLSFVAYGDHTEYLYLSKLPVSGGSSIQYDIPPKPVEILARNIFGVPLSGVAVSVQGGATTLPDRGLLAAFFGWGDDYSSADLANATMTGTTGSDGGITFMMTDALKYNVTFSDPARGIDETVELMPHDTQYMFILGSMGAAPVAGMPNMTLWADGAEGASPTLRGYYSDPAGTTSALYFVVERINGTVRTEVNNQSLGAVQTASPSYAVDHTTGAMYSWGFRATTPDRGALQQWNGITLHSRLVELPIEESAYFWVSMCLVFLFAGLFSGNNIKYGFVAFPMFCGVLWYIGWLDIAGITLGIVMVLGVLMYLAKVQVA